MGNDEGFRLVGLLERLGSDKVDDEKTRSAWKNWVLGFAEIEVVDKWCSVMSRFGLFGSVA